MKHVNSESLNCEITYKNILNVIFDQTVFFFLEKTLNFAYVVKIERFRRKIINVIERPRVRILFISYNILEKAEFVEICIHKRPVS